MKKIIAVLINLSIPIYSQTVSQVEIFSVDLDATGYGTFQSHNQKVIANQYGIFLAYMHRDIGDDPSSNWRLLRSTNRGGAFSLVHQNSHNTHPPILETDEHGNIYMIHSDWFNSPQNSYFNKFNPEDNFSVPLIRTISNTGNAQKYVMMYDRQRQKFYYIANNDFDVRFVTLDMNGQVINNYRLTVTGDSAALHFPHLSLDRNGDLYAAWSACVPWQYTYHGIHFMISKSGGLDWQKLDGTPLEIPVVADEFGPTDRVNLDDEFGPENSSWLHSILARDGKVHFSYLAGSSRQHYVRFDAHSACKDLDFYPLWKGDSIIVSNSFDGFFVSYRQHEFKTIYAVQRSSDNRIAVLASVDRGATWHDYAKSSIMDEIIHNLGGSRWVTDDGYIIGSFGIHRKVFFFRVKVGEPLFQSQVGWTYSGTFGGWNSSVGDLNGDGKTDLLLYFNDQLSWRSWVTLSHGDGTFTTPIPWEYTGHFGAWNTGTGDFNGDGKTDLLLWANDQVSWRSWVALSRGDGTFTAPISWEHPGHFGGWSTGTGDFNGDGKTDLLLWANDQVSGRSWVAMSHGDGVFEAPVMWEYPGVFNGWNTSIGDFNGDGKSDLLLYIKNAAGWKSAILISQGDGNFNTPVHWTYTANLEAMQFDLGDFNGDGRTDLILHNNDEASWMSLVALSTESGIFSPVPKSWVYIGNFSAYNTSLGDVNGDSKTDLILYQNDVNGWRSWVAFSSGSGRFQDPISWSTLSNFEDWRKGVGDFDGDGKADIYLYFNDAFSWRSYVALSAAQDPLPTSVSEHLSSIPSRFTLHQNFPNPFNSTTVIKYELTKASYVNLTIYNILGQKVRTLVDQQLDQGYYQVLWKGQNDENIPVGSGVYIYRLEGIDFVESRKLVLLK